MPQRLHQCNYSAPSEHSSLAENNEAFFDKGHEMNLACIRDDFLTSSMGTVESIGRSLVQDLHPFDLMCAKIAMQMVHDWQDNKAPDPSGQCCKNRWWLLLLNKALDG